MSPVDAPDGASSRATARYSLIRVGVLVVALGLLLLLRSAVPDATGAIDRITLAAVGFVILAAFTVGELGRDARLPRITGYILSGAILGPRVSDLLSSGVVEDMKVFNTLALGLIALSAGLELDWAAIRRVARTLLGTLVAKVPLLLLLVGGGYVILERSFGFTTFQSEEALWATALVLAILGIGTSPAIALAVASDAKSKGRLTDLTLAMAVVKDLVVVVSLAVALAVAKAWLSPDAEIGAEALLRVAEELLGSIALGATIGGLLVAYIRFVHREMLLVVTVVVLVGAEAAAALHLELLLTFISAGFVVRNLSRHAEELHHPLERVALPVFVVFFTTAGAAVDLGATARLLPVASTLVVARMLAYFLAGRIGAWVGSDPPLVRKWAWLGYWPQAGVTLGLVSLAASRLPEVAAPLQQVGFSVVALNLLIGPIALGLALRGAKETEEAPAGPEETPARPDAEPPPEPVTHDLPPLPPLPEPVESPGPALRSLVDTDPPRTSIETLSGALESIADRFLADRIEPFAHETQSLVQRILGDSTDAAGVLSGVRKALADETAPSADEWRRATEQLRMDLAALLLELPQREKVPMGAGLLVARENDRVAVRLHRWTLRQLRTLNHRVARTRLVRLQILARASLELRIVDGVRGVGRASFEHHARVLDEVRAVVENRSPPAVAAERVAGWTERWLAEARSQLVGNLRRGILELARLVSDAGAPGAEAGRIRLSRLQSPLSARLARLARDPARWEQVAAAGLATLRAEALLAEAEEKVAATLENRVWSPLAQLDDAVLPVIRRIAQRLDALHAEVEGKPADQLDLEATLAKVRSSFPKSERRIIRRGRATFGRSTRSRQLSDDFDRLLAAAPRRLEILVEEPSFDGSERMPVVVVPLAQRLEACFGRLVNDVRGGMNEAELLVRVAGGRLNDLTQLAVYGVDSAFRWEVDHEARRRTATRALARSRDLVSAFAEKMADAVGTASSAAEKAAEAARTDLTRMLVGRRSPASRVGQTFRDRGRAVQSAVRDAVRRLRARGRALRLQLSARAGLSERPAPPRDFGEVRTRLSLAVPPVEGLSLPAIYLRAFDPEPIDDPKLAVAHQAAAARLRGRIESRRGAHTIVEADPGGGRTSFLNTLERSVKSRRVVRIDAAFHPRDEGLIGALSSELGCADYALAVSQSLAGQPTLALIDDLGHHIMPTPEGMYELEEFLRVVVDTGHAVTWVVTSEPGHVEVLAELAPLLGVFTERERLPPLDADTLEEVVEARIRLTGVSVRFPRRGLLGRREVRTRRGRKRYFEQLADLSQGNLRAALSAHLRSVRPEPGGGLSVHRPEHPGPIDFSRLDARTVACLGMVARLGPFDERELASNLLVDVEVVRRHVVALTQSGLLERDGGRILRIPPASQQPILAGLREIGLLNGASR